MAKYSITLCIGVGDDFEENTEYRILEHVFQTIVEIQLDSDDTLDNNVYSKYLNDVYFAERYVDLIEKSKAISSMLGYPFLPFPDTDDISD